jgi:hypothetical protein
VPPGRPQPHPQYPHRRRWVQRLGFRATPPVPMLAGFSLCRGGCVWSWTIQVACSSAGNVQGSIPAPCILHLEDKAFCTMPATGCGGSAGHGSGLPSCYSSQRSCRVQTAVLGKQSKLVNMWQPSVLRDKRLCDSAGIAGAVSRTATAPVDRLKMLMQIADSGKRLTLRSAFNQMASEGADVMALLAHGFWFITEQRNRGGG